MGLSIKLWFGFLTLAAMIELSGGAGFFFVKTIAGKMQVFSDVAFSLAKVRLRSTLKAFTEVSRSVAKVGELVREIVFASKEQAEGVGQINKAVAEMDRITQRNAANAEESAGASEEMNAQAEQINRFVRQLLAVAD